MDITHEKPKISSGLAHHTPAACLRVTGEDALPFLQGQFTQELRGAEAHAARYGLWLNQKGRVLADSWVLRLGPREFLVVSLFSPAEVIRQRLESYIIADDVTLEDQTSGWRSVSLVGAAAEAALTLKLGGTLPVPGEFRRVGEGFIFAGRRARTASWEWLAPAGAEPTLADLPVLSGEALAQLRISDAIPAVPADLGPGDLPNEGGLDLDAVSYTKGCYLGQEVMARLKAMGQVRRRLMRVQGPGAAPAGLPLPLFNGAKRVAELRSATTLGQGGFVGLAMVNLLGLDPAAPLSFSAEVPGAVRVVAEDGS